MNDQPSMRERIVAANAEHPEWTAREIADNLEIERYHVYNHARAANLTLPAAPASDFTKGRNVVVRPAAPVPAPEDMPDDFTVFADSPAGMVAAQHQMIRWCDEKIAVTCREQEEAKGNAFEASGSGFSVRAWDERAVKLGKKIDFYEKVKAALQAGYYIVPPFPVEIFAIRTKAKNARGDWKTNRDAWGHRQKEQRLPAGEGRYVSPTPTLDTEQFEEPRPGSTTGETRLVQHWKPADLLDVVDFPFALAPAAVMNATAAAMAAKVFDRLGVLPGGRSPDPIVCGQILIPHRGWSPLTFFVTWWLDTRTL